MTEKIAKIVTAIIDFFSDDNYNILALAFMSFMISALALVMAVTTSCSSVRYGSHSCGPDGSCSTQWYDSTVISKPSKF